MSLKVYLQLGRVSNLPTVWTNVLAGAVLSGGGSSPGTLAGLCLALSLFYTGGMYLNDAFDRHIDARERPERPIPAGVVGARRVFGIGYGLLLAGGAIVFWLGRGNWPPAVAGGGLAGTIVLYDAWHKGNPLGPVLMGLCRVWIYLIAGLVVATLTAEVWAGAAVLFAYLIGLTVWAKQERGYPRGKFAAVVLLIVPLIYGLPTLAITPVGTATYLGFLAVVTYAVTRPARAVAHLIAGISLVDALLIAGHGSPGLAMVAVIGFPATIACQRYVTGT